MMLNNLNLLISTPGEVVVSSPALVDQSGFPWTTRVVCRPRFESLRGLRAQLGAGCNRLKFVRQTTQASPACVVFLQGGGDLGCVDGWGRGKRWRRLWTGVNCPDGWLPEDIFWVVITIFCLSVVVLLWPPPPHYFRLHEIGLCSGCF